MTARLLAAALLGGVVGVWAYQAWYLDGPYGRGGGAW